jgi:tRNA isopentenyl-2-thiomethyl-A-37 hydroxylase MiaE
MEGVQILKKHEVNHFLSTLVPEKIERFSGSHVQRQAAVNRAIKMVGKVSYNLITNNCEHYKNFVQFGKKYSAQVDVAGRVTAITGGVAVVAGLASKNPKVAGWGLFALALGILAVGLANQGEEE